MGKVKMIAYDIETATKVIKNRNSSKAAESGGFVLWQMNPDMWYVELALGGSKIHAGCNGKLVWRHTPWLGPHAAKGPVRPLRRALQVNLSPISQIQGNQVREKFRGTARFSPSEGKLYLKTGKCFRFIQSR